MKTCTTCKQEKPLNSFYKSIDQKDGRTLICAPCARAKNQAHRAAKRAGKRDDLKIITKAEFMSICTVTDAKSITVKATLKANNSIRPYLFKAESMAEANQHINQMYVNPKKLAESYLHE